MERLLEHLRKLEKEARTDYLGTDPKDFGEARYARGVYVGKLDVLNEIIEALNDYAKEEL